MKSVFGHQGCMYTEAKTIGISNGWAMFKSIEMLQGQSILGFQLLEL